MSTHTSEHRALDVDRLCDLVEVHGSSVAMVLLWMMPALAMLVAFLYT